MARPDRKPENETVGTLPKVAPARFSQVFVLGVPRCGSTLLGRLLDCHPRIGSPGEMTRIDLSLKHGHICSCGEPFDACPFWSTRLSILGDLNYDYFRYTPAVFDRVRREMGADVLVDLSKTRIWRMTRGLRAPLRGVDAGFIWILRDPRGIMASSLRRKRPIAGKLKAYMKWTRRYDRFVRTRGDSVLTISYEDLCRDPEAILHEVCAFIGIEFDDALLHPGDHVHHFVHSSRSTYLRGTNEIRVDERWKETLDPELRATIEAEMRKVPRIREHYLERGM